MAKNSYSIANFKVSLKKTALHAYLKKMFNEITSFAL